MQMQIYSYTYESEHTERIHDNILVLAGFVENVHTSYIIPYCI